LQTTSHYFVHLTWQKNGEITGNLSEKERLFTFLKKSAYWYLIAAIAFAIILIPAGSYFFSLKKSLPIHFHWHLPWILVVIGSAVNLSLAPFLASIEGSGKVAEVYRFRTQQLFLASGISWLVLVSGAGLYMLAANVWINALYEFGWLVKKYKLYLIAVWHASQQKLFSWKKEVWPLQWRIALSWISGFFISQIFTPLLFYYAGPVNAGQMGVSITIINMLSLISITWINVRSPQMGKYAAQRQWSALNNLFKRAFYQSAGIFIISAIALGSLLLALKPLAVSERLLPWDQILILLASILMTHIISAIAMYLRAHRQDPFMPFSLVGAALVALGSWYGAAHYGSLGVCWAVFLINLLYGLPSTLWLLIHCKHRWHQANATPHNPA